MFTITDKQDMDALNKYNAEITRWRKYNKIIYIVLVVKWITN